MTIHEVLHGLLAGDATIAGFIGGRIYRLPAPQEAGYPLITFFEVSGSRVWRSHTRDDLFQVDVWAQDFSQARTLANAVINLLDGTETVRWPDMELVGIDFRQEQELCVDGVYHIPCTFGVDWRTTGV